MQAEVAGPLAPGSLVPSRRVFLFTHHHDAKRNFTVSSTLFVWCHGCNAFSVESIGATRGCVNFLLRWRENTLKTSYFARAARASSGVWGMDALSSV
jgi:hypothetical protein